MIIYHLKLAIRNLLKNKLYSALIIGGFAIGFTACILIGLYYFTERNVNKDFTNFSRIYRLYDAKKNRCNLDYNLFPILAANYPEIENACPMEFSTGFSLTLKNDETNANTAITGMLSTTNSFFSMFSAEVVQSVSNVPFSEKESIALTESVAKVLFGAQNPLGHKVNINNYFSGTVTAIIKDLPTNSSFKAELFLNSENENYRMSSSFENNRMFNPTNHFLLVKEGADITKFTDNLNRTIGSYKMDIDSVGVQNLADIYLSTGTMKDMHFKGNNKMLRIFLAIAALIILLSSINYLNYTISMQFSKLKEIGINKTNGAGLWQLAAYSFTEVTLGIVLSVILSFFIAILLMPSTEILFGKALSFGNIRINEVLPGFVVLILTIILVNSMAPLYVLSRFKVNEFLSGSGKRKGKQFGKQILLTFQLTASIVLIGAVIVIFKQLNFVKNADLGFDKELLVRIELPYKIKNTEAFKQETEKLPFVKSNTLSAGCPGMISLRMGSKVGDNIFTVSCITVGDDYLKTMGIDLLEGRQFHQGDNNKVCMMNEEAIRKFEWDNIDGKKFMNGREGGYDVVGVTRNFYVNSMHTEIDPVALIYDPGQRFGVLSVRLSPGNIGEYMASIKQVWKSFIPNEPMNFVFYDDQFQAMYSKEERLAKSISFFSFIAIVLTCMGILGQIFMICLNRIKEIGIRKVNGARVAEILAMLNRDFVKWVAIAFVIATPIAYYAMSKWLESFAYKTSLSWWIFALAGVLALGIALLTVSWQSWRAATRNPVEALRYE